MKILKQSMMKDAYDPRRATLSYSNFVALVGSASECDNLEDYMIECGGSIAAKYSSAQMATIMRMLWLYHDEGLAGLRNDAEMSRAGFSRLFRIPIRTLENWDAHVSPAPDYVSDLIAYAFLSELGVI